MEYGPLCGNCQKMYHRRTPPENPPCGTCRIDPLEENLAAVTIFLKVRYQLIMGVNGPVDINHLAIDAAMKREGIQGIACFNKVLILGQWWLDKIRNQDDES